MSPYAASALSDPLLYLPGFPCQDVAHKQFCCLLNGNVLTRGIMPYRSRASGYSL